MTSLSHIAFICDGNGRWAKSRGLPRTAGHIAGLKKTRTVVDWCIDRGVQNVSVFLWSTENWKRDSREVSGIMGAVVRYGPAFARHMHRRGVRLIHAGLRENIEPRVLAVIDESIELTRHNTAASLCLAFNYGGKTDILHALSAAVTEADGKPITEQAISGRLMSSPMPDVDLLVRTGGEFRISNFMLWQAAEAEFRVSHTLWPDFSQQELDGLITDYAALSLAPIRRASAPSAVETPESITLTNASR